MNFEIPDKLTFEGPIQLTFEGQNFEEISDKGGLYLWCVQARDGTYRVHYVGEAQNIRYRISVHAQKQRDGAYNAYDPVSLQENLLILTHRASKGLVGNYCDENLADINRTYFHSITLFYAELPDHYSRSDRCIFETAIAHAVEDYGQNILAIGRLSLPKNLNRTIHVDTGESAIEALTGVEILL